MRIPDLEYMIEEEMKQHGEALCINCGLSKNLHVKTYSHGHWETACIHKFSDRPARYESAV